jgi:hypothetical protein
LGVPFLFLAAGLLSLASVAASLYLRKTLIFIPVDGAFRFLLVGASCGIAIAVFIWWVFLEMKRRQKP